MSLAWKVAVTVVLFALAAAAAVILIVNLLGTPPTVDYIAEPGQPVNVTLQTVGRLRIGHPPDLGVVPRPVAPGPVGAHHRLPGARTHRINVTIYKYDSGSPLRNQQLGQVTGTYGNAALLNGKRFRVINSNAGNGVGPHLPIPSLGINVPLYGNNGNANLCAAAPCTTKSPHNVIRFSFTSPGPGTTAGSASSLRAGLPLRQRWAHVDAGLHGRLHEGGGVSDTQAAGPGERPPSRPAGRPATGPTTGGA